MITDVQPISALVLDGDLARPSRLELARSKPFLDLQNGYPEAEIKSGISEQLKASLSISLIGARLEATSIRMLPREQKAAFIAEIRAFATLTCGGWPPEQIQAWIEQVAAELLDLPARMVAEAIREARRRIWEPKRFLSWVYERIEADLAKLRLEIQMLERLERLASQ